MVTLACIVLFLASTAWCAERLVRAPLAAQALLAVPTLVMSWVALLTLRTPTPWRALLAFTLIDLAVLVVSTLAVLRLLGGFERTAPADGDDDGGSGVDEPVAPPRGPHPRRAARRPGGRRPGTPPRRPRGAPHGGGRSRAH